MSRVAQHLARAVCRGKLTFAPPGIFWMIGGGATPKLGRQSSHSDARSARLLNRRVAECADGAGSKRDAMGGRMRFWVWSLLFAVSFQIAAGSAAAANIEAGKMTFKKCALCHTNEKGKNKVGPSLFGIVGRKSASLDNYDYSDAMKKFDHVWTPQELDTYLADPRAVVSGTKMIFPGIKDKTERENLIAYLETLK
jgi:cytochrome c